MINIWIDTKISRLVGYMSRDGWLYPNPLWLVMNPINIPLYNHYPVIGYIYHQISQYRYPRFIYTYQWYPIGWFPIPSKSRNPGGVSRPLRCQDSAVRPESRLCPHCCASETTAEPAGKKGDRTRKNGDLPREKWKKCWFQQPKMLI